jgi:3-phenylpropionate/cinnamic acid dioxygenase small subunit
MDIGDSIRIHELMSRYAYALDEHDMAMLEACFAPDASFTIDISGSETVGPFVGREAIMELIRSSAAAQTDRRRHVVSNVFVETSGDDCADVVSNLTLFSIMDGHLNLVTTGIYRDHVTATDGCWTILKRHLYLDLPY